MFSAECQFQTRFPWPLISSGLCHGLLVKQCLQYRDWITLATVRNKNAQRELVDFCKTYAHKDQAETSVLFELIARRYEYKSIAIAANQPFSAWDQIFPDKAMTIAAIDRLVHHATILEMNAESFRRRAASDNQKAYQSAPATTSSVTKIEGAVAQNTKK